MAITRTERRTGWGFTLIELLVVVGIIVLLLAILLPALAAARIQGYVVATQALMTGLKTNCETYATTFSGQYPGPVSEREVAKGVGASKITGTQNMLLGLTYAMNPSNTAPWTTAIPASGTAMYTTGDLTKTFPTAPATTVNAGAANTPIDYGNYLGLVGTPTPTTPMFRQYPAFYNPTSKELSPMTVGSPTATAWAAGGVPGALQLGSTPAIAFPTVLDRFPDALPLLYFRRTQGVDTPAVVPDGGTTAAPVVGAYYMNSNYEYTASTTMLSPLTNLKWPQGATSPIGATTAGAAAAMQALINPGSTTQAVGGFVLIAAGKSRIYGKAAETIVVVGGQ